ncbi:uncharacterized protein V2V93DRAFT_365383 [Kockiozyma suomiensis]|uniref:uncharacterized protein n=1 Tax=Kockiozyma suomiensis TaxID=1337062 RepID=UPI0033430DFB
MEVLVDDIRSVDGHILSKGMGALNISEDRNSLVEHHFNLHQHDFVQFLPTELVELIFEDTPIQLLVELRLVARSWDRFIMSTPSFWKWFVVDEAVRDPNFLFGIQRGIESSGSSQFALFNLEPTPYALEFNWPEGLNQLVYTRMTVVQSINFVPLLVRGHFPNLENIDFQEFSPLHVSHKSDNVVYDVPLSRYCVDALPNITELTICKIKARTSPINSELYNTIFDDGSELFQSPSICGRRLNRLLRLLPNLKSFKMTGFRFIDDLKPDDECEEWEPTEHDSLTTPNFEKNLKLGSVELNNCLMRIMPVIPPSCKRVTLADTGTVPQRRRKHLRTDGTTEAIYYPSAPEYDHGRREAVFETEYKNVETLEFSNIHGMTAKQLVSVLTRINGYHLKRLRLSSCRYLALDVNTLIDSDEVDTSLTGSSLQAVDYIVKLCSKLCYLDLGNQRLGGVATDRALIGLSRLRELRVLWLTLSMNVTWFGIAAIIGEWDRYLASPDVSNLRELLRDVTCLPNCSLQVLDISGCPNLTIEDAKCLRRAGLNVYYETNLPASFRLP